jgi:hypothetical protein
MRTSDGAVIDGGLPPTTRRLVMQWTELRREMLMSWRAARSDGRLEHIGGLDDD